MLEAKWAPLNEDALTRQATDILVAEYQSVEDEGEVQKAFFKVVDVWKGEAKGVIKVRGVTQVICAPVVNFTKWRKGKYLLILKKEEDLFNPFNGGFSVVPITEARVSWFVKGGGVATRKAVELAKVKEKISQVVRAEVVEFEKGVAKAKEELAKGVTRYEIVGQPRLTDHKLKRLAKEKLKVEVVLLGCAGSPNEKFHEGHQKTVKAFLLKKYGYDPVLKLEESLR